MADFLERQDAAEDRASAPAIAKQERDRARAGEAAPVLDLDALMTANFDAGIAAVRAKVRRGRPQ